MLWKLFWFQKKLPQISDIIEAKKEININEERLADSRKKLRGIEDLEENFSHLNKSPFLFTDLIIDHFNFF